MNRRSFLLGVFGMAAGGAVLTSQAHAAQAGGLWDELQKLDAGEALDGDLPAEGASEAQRRHSRGRSHYRGRRVYRPRYGRRPRGRAYGYYRGPRRRRRYWGRRRVCRVVRNRWGGLVRRCWRVW